MILMTFRLSKFVWHTFYKFLPRIFTIFWFFFATAWRNHTDTLSHAWLTNNNFWFQNCIWKYKVSTLNIRNKIMNTTLKLNLDLKRNNKSSRLNKYLPMNMHMLWLFLYLYVALLLCGPFASMFLMVLWLLESDTLQSQAHTYIYKEVNGILSIPWNFTVSS